MLSQKDYFAKALMVDKPWRVHEIMFDQNTGKLDIRIDFERGSTFFYKDKELGIGGREANKVSSRIPVKK
jgi:hypothetical protein